MTIEYVALAIGAFLIVVIMIWKRLRFIGARLIEMQNELNELRTIEFAPFHDGVECGFQGGGIQKRTVTPIQRRRGRCRRS